MPDVFIVDDSPLKCRHGDLKQQSLGSAFTRAVPRRRFGANAGTGRGKVQQFGAAVRGDPAAKLRLVAHEPPAGRFRIEPLIVPFTVALMSLIGCM